MRKTILSLLAFFCIFAVASAQEVRGLTLGYCNGQVASKGVIGSSQKDYWISGAIHIDKGDIMTYAGCHIDSIRAGLASKLNLDSLVVWVRSSLDGENLAQGSLSAKALKKGWNNVKLNQAYTVADQLSDGLYIGYSFHQKASSFGLSVVTPGVKNGLFVKMGNEAWADRSDEGVLSIEALVFGDKLPKLNLELKSISVQPVFVVAKGQLKVEATVKNLAAQTVTGFDFTTAISGIGETYTAHVDTTLAYKEEKTVSFTVTPAITTADPAERTVTVTLSKLNEGDDENMENNTLSQDISVVAQDYTRNVLLEEFTTEQCPNCPRMAGYIKTALASGKYDDRLNVICHHSGYYTDWLTIPSDNDYLWFFNSGSTYAPAIMTDRDAFDGSTPVFCPGSQGEFEAYIDYCLVQPAYVSLNITASEGDDNTLHVNVSGDRSKTEITSGNPRICVVLVEDDIAARSQAGANSSYIHQHVNRANNGTWGEELQWNGDTYSYDCSFSIRNTWNRNNMHVVAFIYGYDKDNATNCRVANSASITYPLTTGISSATTATADMPKTYYSLSGKQVSESALCPGVYIVKQGGTTSKVIIK